MSRVTKNISHVQVRIKLLKKGISRKTLQKKLKVSPQAISNALCGIRPSLLNKINDFANNYNP